MRKGRKKLMERMFSFLLVLVMVVTLGQTAGNGRVLAAESSGVLATAGDVVVLYTNDVHNAYQYSKDSAWGYAKVAGIRNVYRDIVGASNVELVDCGDAIQGGPIGTLSKGADLVDIMNVCGYTLAIPGNHEFDFGMDTFLNYAQNKAKYQYISCNFMDLKNNTTVFDPYVIKTYGELKVAYIGISTPETFTKSTPTYFQDSKGNYIYGFCEDATGTKLYNKVQSTIDAAKEAGADVVVAIAHLGTDEASVPWTSKEVIAHTSGIDVLLDGHSHTKIEKEIVKDKDNQDVILSSTLTKLANVGSLVIKKAEAGYTVDTALIACDSMTVEDDEATASIVAEKEAGYKDKVAVKVAKTDYDLVVNDPKTGKRMVRNQETNLGDLCADAYKTLLGADCAIVNGGGVRDILAKGDITLEQIIKVHPFSNVACLGEVTGQQILDALEMGAKDAVADGSKENGGFLQVSGITYDIDTRIESSVKLDDKKNFISVDGEYRVKNVKINGEKLDVTKKYTLATHNYAMKSYGDGMTMFKGTKILKDEVMLDNEVLTNYIQTTLKGVIPAQYKDPYGQGRIRVIIDTKVSDEGTTITYLKGYETATAFVKDTNEVKEEVTKTSTGEVRVEEALVVGEDHVVVTNGVASLDTTTVNKVVALVTNALSATEEKAKTEKVATPIVKINMATATLVPVEVLTAAKGKAVDVEFVMGDYSWTISGKDITGSNLKNINLKVDAKANNVPSKAIEAVVAKEAKVAKQLSLASEGEFGFKAKLRINIGKEYAGQYASLYYYNKDKLEATDSKDCAVDKDGYTTLTFTHASDYVVTVAPKAANTGDNTNEMLWIMLLLVGGAMTTYAMKKKQA